MGSENSRPVRQEGGDELGFGLSHGQPVTCPLCQGLGGDQVGQGEIAGTDRTSKRLRKVRNRKCRLCRGRGWVLS